MAFRLTEDQEALVQGLRSFCQGRVPLERLSALEGKSAVDRALWSELAEMGVFHLRLSASQGGVGLGHAEGVLVFAELGRRLVPGPLAWSHLAAGRIEGAAGGQAVVGGIDLLGSAGDPVLVEHLEHLDALLVLREEGVFRVDPAAMDAEPVSTPLDPLTPLHHAPRVPRGERLAGPEDARRLRRVATALVAGQLLGIAESTLELAVAYAKGREQFGRPIGSFQALKHIMADMFVRQEVARAAAYAAGATLDAPEVGDASRAVASAKLVAADAALKNARACIQIHGGMGYTWEIPAHYFLKRAWVLETSFGSADEHAERVARSLDPGSDAG